MEKNIKLIQADKSVLQKDLRMRMKDLSGRGRAFFYFHASFMSSRKLQLVGMVEKWKVKKEIDRTLSTHAHGKFMKQVENFLLFQVLALFLRVESYKRFRMLGQKFTIEPPQTTSKKRVSERVSKNKKKHQAFKDEKFQVDL